MKKFILGAAAALTTLTGAMAGAAPADAAGFGGYHGAAAFHGGGYGYRGGGYGYRGPGVGGAVVAGLAGLAVGAALAQPHGYYGYGYAAPAYAYGPPPAYYVGPAYYGYYGGCHREWVWSRWGGYRLVAACY